jgi:hypothetical protein
MAASCASDIAIHVAFIILRAFPDWKTHVTEGEIFTGKFRKTAETELERAQIIVSWHDLAALPPECLAEISGQWRASSPTPRLLEGLASALPFNRMAPCDVVEHYAKLDYWTLDDATALLLGLNPEWCTWNQVEKFVTFDITAKRYARLRQALQRSIEAKKLKEPLRPRALLQWAPLHLDVPPELKEAVHQFAKRRGELTLHSEEETGGVSRKLLLHMVAVLMRLRFPEADITKKAGWLSNELKLQGSPGNEDTCKKALRECSDAFADLPHCTS